MGPAGSVSGPRHVPWHAALCASIRAKRDSPYTRWVACFGGSRQAPCRQDGDMSERACGASCSRRRCWAATTGQEEHAAGVRCLLPDPVRCLMRMQRSWRRVSFAAPTGRSIGSHTGPMSKAGDAQCLVRLCAAARGSSRTKPASTALGFFLALYSARAAYNQDQPAETRDKDLLHTQISRSLGGVPAWRSEQKLMATGDSHKNGLLQTTHV